MSADTDDPLLRRRRQREHRRATTLLIGGGLGIAVVLAGVIAYAVAWPVRPGAGGGDPAQVQLGPGAVRHEPGAEDVRRIADHPWWKGMVTTARVNAILDEMCKKRAGTIFFNQAGELLSVDYTETDLSGGCEIYWDRMSSNHPEVYAALKGDVRRVELNLSYGKRLSRAEATDMLEDNLRARSRDECNKPASRPKQPAPREFPGDND